MTSGGTPSRSRPEYYSNGTDGHIWIKSKELLDCSLADSEERISDLGLQKSSAKYVEAGSVLVGMYGANVGQLGWLKSPATVNQAVCSLSADPKVANYKWLFYALLENRRALVSLAHGAAQQNISQEIIRGFEIEVPGLQEQEKIAAILSVYDDLIENNTRRIEIFEEMARRLYEEWFVQFRFPGYEGVKFKESELGLIPEGWEVVALERAVEINPKTKVERDGEKVFVPMGALSETGMVISDWEVKSGNSGAKFQNGDTLVARISPCLENGKTGFVDFLPSSQLTACGSTEFIVLRSRSLCPEMVYCLSRSDRFREVAMKSMSGATGRQRVRVESLVGYPIAQPESELVAKYHAFAQPCFKEIRVLANKNANLRAQRDLLLPKLISGEIDVSDIPMPT
ncbi:restriction endonuclease subunit S [Stutzerimonas stutzeri]|nr:restriction endonuclease subunit S [Stutzerimonas stutzeri]